VRVILERQAIQAGGRDYAGGEVRAAMTDARERQVWWSDAADDPWRDPASPAVIVSRTEPTPPPEDVAAQLAPNTVTRTTTMIALVAATTGLLAGGLGGAIGYLAASRNANAPVVIGATGANANQRPPDSVAAMIKRVMPSVVTIKSTGSMTESVGSGFIISADGYVLTNEHVVSGVPDRNVTVTFSDTSTAAGRVVGRDPESDLAVVKVDRQSLKPVEFADSDTVVVGDPVVAIGSPLALPGTVTAGIVSAVDRTIETNDPGGVSRYYAAIQTDAAVNRGNSGGPLFDLAGRVIGVNSVIKAVVDGTDEGGNIGIAFAIPMNQAARTAAELIDTGKARRTVIGAQLSRATGGPGARITGIDAGGPADGGGIRVGDVVIRIGDHAIDQPPDLIALVRRYNPGTVITVTYVRGAETQSTSVTLVADAK
jgi:putative serine protease PepD